LGFTTWIHNFFIERLIKIDALSSNRERIFSSIIIETMATTQPSSSKNVNKTLSTTLSAADKIKFDTYCRNQHRPSRKSKTKAEVLRDWIKTVIEYKFFQIFSLW